ncbi:iron ABC transporter permease [Niveispirillum sp.]|uniref:ABC transporter permease n=1 Tax=Niveispirillum sp. TaxID=1917217 RepID=UPI001B41F45A|nr:iron ABC transporter permease [Niveispirillum sp.]MBP7335554.1 iron ABC transporter permease [Niveispirillum sp.]
MSEQALPPTLSPITAPAPASAPSWRARLPSGWTLAVLAIALAVALPVLIVGSRVFVSSNGVWAHLADTVLWTYIRNTLMLAGGVAVGVSVIGVGTAWLVTMCRFPGQRWLEWALLLPMAVPAYVMAYVYTDLLQFVGPVQTTLREMFGWRRADYWFPDIRSLGGAIAVLSFVLYPYVYLLARAAFLEQSVCVLEVARTLGAGAWRSFARVALPLARPAIAAGLALAMMEVLADFGTVQYFAVDTFTTGIYRTWFAMGEPVAAAQLASVLMLFVMVLVVMERTSRGRARYFHSTGRYRVLPSYTLRGGRALGAQVACLLPLLLGFALPVLLLVRMAVMEGDSLFAASFRELAGNSFTLAGITSVLAVALAALVAYGLRLRPTPVLKGAARVAAMGYAVPGSVIAVGILIPAAHVDNAVDGFMRATFGVSTGLLLSGTIVAIVYAYLVRFLAVSFNTVEASLSKIRPTMDQAARILGQTPGKTLLKVHTPIMRGSLLTAALLVFVDVMKELPATMIVRPFNFDTLAVRVYTLASDERLAEASTPALAIVAVGIIPVILLSRAIAKSRPGTEG